MKLLRLTTCGLAVLCISAIAIASAHAATEYQVVPIWQSEPTPNAKGDRLKLSVHFAVENVHNERVLKGREDGRIDFEDTATAVIDGFEPAQAKVGAPETPLKIVLLIDKSGSMRSKVLDKQGNVISNPDSLDPTEPDLIRMDLVKDAASQAVERAPSDAAFSVVAFAETQENVTEGFISKADGLNTIQDKLKRGFFPNRVGTGNTCIYDALDNVIGQLRQEATRDPASRFAVVLFTDGKDSEGGPCRTGYKPENIVNFVREFRSANMANPQPFPIYPIAPCIIADGSSPSDKGDAAKCGNIDDENLGGLKTLAVGTNADFETGDLNSISDSFAQVMELLGSQWEITAELPARENWNTVKFALTVQGSDEPFVVSATFKADRVWGATPMVEIVGLDPNPEVMRYEARLKITNAELLAPFSLELWDAKTGGTTKREHIHEVQPAAEVTVFLPIKDLELGKEYWIRLRSDRSIALFMNGERVDAYPFTPVAQMRLEIINAERDAFLATDQLALTIRPIGFSELDWPELIEAVVITPDGEEPIAHTKRSFEITATNILLVKLDERILMKPAVAPYRIELRLKGEPAGITVVSRDAVPIAPRPPVSFAVMIRGVISNTYVQLSFAGVAVLVLGWLLVSQLFRLRVEEPRPASDSTRIAVWLDTMSAEEPEPPTVVHAPAKQRQITVRITRTSDPAQCRTDLLMQLPLSIGRSSAADVTITGDPALGRHHVTLKDTDEGLVIEDMRTANGTWVNGARLDLGGTALIGRATELQLGPNTRLELDVGGG